MSGAVVQLSRALLDALSGHAGVAAVLGDPVRISDGDGDRPAYPYLELIRHEVRPGGSADVAGSEHVLDLAIVSRNDDGMDCRAGIDAVRDALEVSGLDMADWRAVLVLLVFADVLRGALGTWRGVLRIRIVLEAA